MQWDMQEYKHVSLRFRQIACLVVNGIKSERFKYHKCCLVIKVATTEKLTSNNKLAYDFI